MRGVKVMGVDTVKNETIDTYKAIGFIRNYKIPINYIAEDVRRDKMSGNEIYEYINKYLEKSKYPTTYARKLAHLIEYGLV